MKRRDSRRPRTEHRLYDELSKRLSRQLFRELDVQFEERLRQGNPLFNEQFWQIRDRLY